MSKRALVAYASKRGGTAGIAEAIADTFRLRGIAVDCMPVESIRDVTRYDAVVIGSGLYMGRWLRSARHFVTTHADTLRARAVWFFSSGPLDGSAAEHNIPPTRSVANAARLVGARGHVTFGGRLTPDAKGLIAAAMAKKHAGDWRDWIGVQRWAAEVATTIELSAQRARPDAVAPTSTHPLLALLCMWAGILAMVGGLALTSPSAGLLMTAVGVMFMAAGMLLLRRSRPKRAALAHG